LRFESTNADNALVARVAAQHFLERRFQQFGYCGDARFGWSNRRAIPRATDSPGIAPAPWRA
jgi:LacI family transcriptional regulator